MKGSRGSSSRGKEVFDIQPLVLGGNPLDPANKAVISRAEHIELVRYWNRIVRDLRDQQGSGRDAAKP